VKIKVAFGGMVGGEPLYPYANSPVIVSSAFSPIDMDIIPISQP
jgi:hypothetical protein